jgi:hypothetical protein
MGRRMIVRVLLACFITLSSGAFAQSILLKDGKRVVAKSLRRSGDNIMAQSPAVDGQAPLQGEVGYPLSQIERLEFPEPAVLRTTPDLIARGKASDAIAQLESTFTYYAGFRDAPGSHWGEVAILKLMALISLEKDSEAEPLARQIISMAGNPDTIRAAQAHLAGIAGRRDASTSRRSSSARKSSRTRRGRTHSRLPRSTGPEATKH